MSDATTLANGDARHAAVLAWHAAWHDSGDDLSGAQLGAMFGKSRSWGRDRRTEARAELPDATRVPPALELVPEAPERPEPVNPQATGDRLRQAVTTLAVAVVAVVAAVMSYAHMYELAVEAGEGARAALLPLSVDGLVVAGSMSAVTAKRAGRPVGFFAVAAIMLGVAASLGANVLAAEPTVIGRVVAAWPPLALGLSFELLLRQGRHTEAEA